MGQLPNPPEHLKDLVGKGAHRVTSIFTVDPATVRQGLRQTTTTIRPHRARPADSDASRGSPPTTPTLLAATDHQTVQSPAEAFGVSLGGVCRRNSERMFWRDNPSPEGVQEVDEPRKVVVRVVELRQMARPSAQGDHRTTVQRQLLGLRATQDQGRSASRAWPDRRQGPDREVDARSRHPGRDQVEDHDHHPPRQVVATSKCTPPPNRFSYRGLHAG